MPKELARREKLLKKMDQACAHLEQRAKERAGAQQADYQRKVAEREEREGASKGHCEWNLVCLAYSLKRLHTLIQAIVKG